MDVSLSLKSKISNIESVVDFCHSWSMSHGLNSKESNEFALAFDELITDIILFAFREEEDFFDICFYHNPSYLEIIINEKGEPFEPEKYIYNKQKVINENNFNGAGLKIIHKFTDNFLFINKGKSGKEFRLVKNILHHQHISDLIREIPKKEDNLENTNFSVLQVKPEDAEDISKLIYYTYGYTYPKEDMYYPQRIFKYLEKGKKFGVISRRSDGKASGYFAVIKADDSKIGEVGEAVVSPEYRSKGLMSIMMTLLINMSKEKGLKAIFGEAITAHMVSQKVNAKFEFNSTAILLGVYPSTIQKGFNHKQERISVVSEFLMLNQRKELELYLPSRYKKIFKEIYFSLGIKVKDKRITKIEYKETSCMKLKVSYKYLNVSIIVESFSEDFFEVLEKKTEFFKDKGIKVIYIDLPLKNPITKVITDELSNRGFIFSGLLPLFHKEEDYLRMQMPFYKVDFRHIKLLSKMAKKIKKVIQREIKILNSSKKK
jgi:anti-sigma regulatory factor (Ser/Thr protein kinase)/N-acetylglutamate synthase-like GNAT family acetyltransferase